MSFVRDELYLAASNLVQEHGEILTLSRKSETSYNTETGVAVVGGTPGTARVQFLNYKTEDINNGSILRDDRKALIVPIGAFVPEEGDIISGVKSSVKIVKVGSVMQHSNGSLLYVCQTRG